MLSPNALLPCATESARRRHAAHGRICPVCDTTAHPGSDPLAAENERLTALLEDADDALTALLQQPVIPHRALRRIHRHLTAGQKGKAT
jgi:hypothetical protein